MAPTPEAWRRRLANAMEQRRVDSKILAGPRRDSEGLVESGMGRRGHGGIGRLSGQKVAGRKTVGFKSTCPHRHSALWCKYSDFGSVGRGIQVLDTPRGGRLTTARLMCPLSRLEMVKLAHFSQPIFSACLSIGSTDQQPAHQ